VRTFALRVCWRGLVEQRKAPALRPGRVCCQEAPELWDLCVRLPAGEMLEAAGEVVNWFGCAAAPKHFSRSSLQDTVGCMRSEAFAGGTCMTKFLSVGFVLAAATLGSGCFSFSSTKTAPAPAPAPPPVVQRTVYPDGTYVDQSVQPVPR
jgi:hypothetical protein